MSSLVNCYTETSYGIGLSPTLPEPCDSCRFSPIRRELLRQDPRSWVSSLAKTGTVALVARMVTYATGDLLETSSEALVNSVNRVGVMGRGVALAQGVMAVWV